MGLNMIAAVAAGGAVGAVARYMLATQVGHWAGTGFPWGTFAVNVVGCTIMGVLTELFALTWSPSPEIRALLTVGVLGGFTTFSAFSLDAVLLMERNAWLPAIGYVAGSVLLSLAGFFAGMRLLRLVVA
ncbi:MAG: fluoride efflux transporter CrcB [Rhodospirillaceae bacterium]|nr:fluoride efflux transporter CrcB [Rhodospirillaceae bacterium]